MKAYAFRRVTHYKHSAAVSRVTQALADEGFGVITAVDFTETIKKKLNVDFGGEYQMLGACNPQLALRALQADPDVGLLLPCSVVVYETDEGVVIAAINPQALMGGQGNPVLEAVAEDAAQRLARAVENA